MRSLVLAVAWLWVAVPLGWGVFQSVQKSLPLFQGPAMTHSASESNCPTRIESPVDGSTAVLSSIAGYRIA